MGNGGPCNCVLSAMARTGRRKQESMARSGSLTKQYATLANTLNRKVRVLTPLSSVEADMPTSMKAILSSTVARKGQSTPPQRRRISCLKHMRLNNHFVCSDQPHYPLATHTAPPEVFVTMAYTASSATRFSTRRRLCTAFLCRGLKDRIRFGAVVIARYRQMHRSSSSTRYAIR